MIDEDAVGLAESWKDDKHEFGASMVAGVLARHVLKQQVRIATLEAALACKCVCEFTGSGNERKINKTCAFHQATVNALSDAKRDAERYLLLIRRVNTWMGEGRSHAKHRPIDLMPLGLADEIHMTATAALAANGGKRE